MTCSGDWPAYSSSRSSSLALTTSTEGDELLDAAAHGVEVAHDAGADVGVVGDRAGARDRLEGCGDAGGAGQRAPCRSSRCGRGRCPRGGRPRAGSSAGRTRRTRRRSRRAWPPRSTWGRRRGSRAGRGRRGRRGGRRCARPARRARASEAKSTSWPSRASPMATLAGLPPTCSVRSPDGSATMSTRASPMTSSRRAHEAPPGPRGRSPPTSRPAAWRAGGGSRSAGSCRTWSASRASGWSPRRRGSGRP